MFSYADHINYFYFIYLFIYFHAHANLKNSITLELNGTRGTLNTHKINKTQIKSQPFYKYSLNRPSLSLTSSLIPTHTHVFFLLLPPSCYASPPSPPPSFKTSLTQVEPLPTVTVQMSPIKDHTVVSRI